MTGAPDRSPVCRAPFVAMEFDAFGDVQACCANALYPLGNVGRSSLREIWDGPRATALRDALTAGDLSLGCSVCRYRLVYGHGDLARDYYDSFPMPEPGHEWPFSLQFSLHNTCNLACVMCGADRSSKIRSQRSHLAPLPHAYGDRFFEEIVPFLAHAGAVDFSGGEPFLIAEHGRIWDLLIEMEHRPLCSLTTNGSVWNARTERVLDALDTHVSVSIDGMTAETFESIRLGARFDEVLANVERFLAYTRERGTILTMSWSLMRQNWFELGAAARFAEERGIDLKVQTVIEPEFGVQRLPTEELAFVVESLEVEGRTLVPDLDRNRAMWEREVGRLREELELRERPGLRAVCMEPPGPGTVDRAVAMTLTAVGRPLGDDRRAAVEVQARADLARWCGPGEALELLLDGEGVIRGLRGRAALPEVLRDLAIEPGTALADLYRAIEDALDALVWIGEEFDEGDRLVQLLWFGRATRDKAGLVARTLTIAGPAGLTMLVAFDTTLLPTAAPAVPVSLGARRLRASAGA